MAKVVKGNRVLTVSDEAVSGYLKEGYDEINEKGEVVQHAIGGKTVTLAEHTKVVEELEKLKKTQSNGTSAEELEKVKEENKKLKAEIKSLKKAAETDPKAE